MIIAEGPRRAAIRTDEPTAAYRATNSIRRVRAGSTAGTRGGRVVVELSRKFSGMTVRALLGAVYTPGGQGLLTAFEVPVGPALGTTAATVCGSELGGALAPGLPRDFAPGVLDALAGDASDRMLQAGLIRVDRAGFDEAGSGEMAFWLAADLLRRALAALMASEDPTDSIRAALRGW